jgi:hypothetical protein
MAFPSDVHFNLQPSGPFLSFDAGPLQGRVYQNTGHIEIAGPDLAGNAHANAIHFSPPAVHTRRGSIQLGGIVGSGALPQGLELKQQAGAATVTAHLTFAHDGVLRYEVLDWDGLNPLATALAAPSNALEHFYGFGETFGSFDQAGKRVNILTFDEPGTKKNRAYKEKWQRIAFLLVRRVGLSVLERLPTGEVNIKFFMLTKNDSGFSLEGSRFHVGS